MAARRFHSQKREVWVRRLSLGAGSLSLMLMALIVIFLFKEGLSLFKGVGVWDFILGQAWYLTYDPADFGVLPLIMGSLAVTLVSSAMAVPLGVASALYLAEVASHRVREWVKPAIELLASLPSVVLGFVGMVILASLLQDWLDIPTGLNLFNASLMLALMAIPTIASISEDALHAVPRDPIEASLALGATRWETMCRVLVLGALSGIGTAVILGMSRAMGETPYGSEHYHALFAIGIVLFLLTLGFNLVAALVSHRFQQKGAATL